MEGHLVNAVRGLMQRQQGMICSVVLFGVAAMLAITAMLVRLCGTELAAVTLYTDGLAAQYVAEAGIKKAVIQLQTNPDWSGEKQRIIAGFCDIQVESNITKITARAQKNAAARSVSAYYTLTVPLAQYPIASQDDLIITNSVIASVWPALLGGNHENYVTAASNRNVLMMSSQAECVQAHQTTQLIQSQVAKLELAAKPIPLITMPTYQSLLPDRFDCTYQELTATGDFYASQGTSRVLDNMLLDRIQLYPVASDRSVYYIDGDLTLRQAVMADAMLLQQPTVLFIVNGNVIIENSRMAAGVVATGQIYINNSQIIGTICSTGSTVTLQDVTYQYMHQQDDACNKEYLIAIHSWEY